MLQHVRNKKSSSLTQDLIIGGACIIHHKINQTKRGIMHMKTDKTDKQLNYPTLDPFEESKDDDKVFKISSSQKTKIKYLKSIRKENLLKQNEYNFQRQKMDKIIINQKNEYINAKQFQGYQQQSSQNQNYAFKKLQKAIRRQKFNDWQIERSSKNFQRKILPQITEKFRSFTTSNSKKQIKKNAFFNSSPSSPKDENVKTKRIKDLQLPSKNLQVVQQTKLFRFARNNTTKIQRPQKSQKIQSSNQKNQTKIKSISEISGISGIKKIKKQAKSQRQIKLTEAQTKSNYLIKQVKDEKEKTNKLHVIRQEFSSLINKTNDVQICNEQAYFNAYIEKGNNGMLIKELIKKRWWWHFTDQNPKQILNSLQNSCKDYSTNIQQIVVTQRKKVNLYWSEWLNKPFAQKLTLPNEQFMVLKTVYDQFEFSVPEQSGKFESVKKITDNHTFNMIKEKINLRNANYFKNHFPKPMADQFSQNNFMSENNQNIKNPPNKCQQRLSLKKIDNSHQMKIHNHIIGCLQLHSKKLLFKNLSNYLKKKKMDPFDFIPVTFYIQDMNSQNYQDFLEKYKKINDLSVQDKNIWILKPGQNSNRGFGISVHKQKQQIEGQLIKRLSPKVQNMDNPAQKRGKKSVIVQKYIEKCFLINNRKFDFRCYILITTVNGMLKGYWYGNGYIRTSSEEYNLNDIQNKMIHLTNDAVQSKNSSFGKFQDYNKMSFQGFKKYLQKLNIPESKFQDALKQMKNIAYYLIASVSSKIKRHQYTFELFGLDFMLDQNLKPYLIEANSNPCLDTKGPILTKIIRNLVQNVIMTAVDPLFPAPKRNFIAKKKKEWLDKDYFESNLFELIFIDKKPQSLSEQKSCN